MSLHTYQIDSTRGKTIHNQFSNWFWYCLSLLQIVSHSSVFAPLHLQCIGCQIIRIFIQLNSKALQITLKESRVILCAHLLYQMECFAMSNDDDDDDELTVHTNKHFNKRCTNNIILNGHNFSNSNGNCQRHPLLLLAKSTAIHKENVCKIFSLAKSK